MVNVLGCDLSRDVVPEIGHGPLAGGAVALDGAVLQRGLNGVPLGLGLHLEEHSARMGDRLPAIRLDLVVYLRVCLSTKRLALHGPVQHEHLDDGLVEPVGTDVILWNFRHKKFPLSCFLPLGWRDKRAERPTRHLPS